MSAWWVHSRIRLKLSTCHCQREGCHGLAHWDRSSVCGKNMIILAMAYRSRWQHPGVPWPLMRNMCACPHHDCDLLLSHEDLAMGCPTLLWLSLPWHTGSGCLALLWLSHCLWSFGLFLFNMHRVLYIHNLLFFLQLSICSPHLKKIYVYVIFTPC